MANLLADSRACEFNQSAAGAGRIGGKWGTGPCLPELSEWPGNTSLDLPHCSPVEEASHTRLVCGAFLCRAQHAGTGDALQPLHLWTGRGFASIQVAPSGRGSLVYVAAPQRCFRCPRCVLWRGVASLGGLRTATQSRDLGQYIEPWAAACRWCSEASLRLADPSIRSGRLSHIHVSHWPLEVHLV